MKTRVRRNVTSTSNGLLFVYIQTMLIILSFFLLFLTEILADVKFIPSDIKILVSGTIIPICILIAPVAGIIGRFFCLKAPEKVKATYMLLFSIVIELIYLVVKIADNSSFIGIAPVKLPLILYQLSYVLIILSSIAFLFFLRKLSKLVRRSPTKGTIIILLMVMVLILHIIISYPGILKQVLPKVAELIFQNLSSLSLLFTICFILIFVFYSYFITYLRRGIWHFLEDY